MARHVRSYWRHWLIVLGALGGLATGLLLTGGRAEGQNCPQFELCPNNVCTCPGYSCQSGTCLPAPQGQTPDNAACTTDTECASGLCRLGTCIPNCSSRNCDLQDAVRHFVFRNLYPFDQTSEVATAAVGTSFVQALGANAGDVLEIVKESPNTVSARGTYTATQGTQTANVIFELDMSLRKLNNFAKAIQRTAAFNASFAHDKAATERINVEATFPLLLLIDGKHHSVRFRLKGRGGSPLSIEGSEGH